VNTPREQKLLDEKLKKALAREMRDVNLHFKKDGWDIESSGILEQVLYRVFGYHPSDKLWAALLKNYTRKFDMKYFRILVCKRKPKRKLKPKRRTKK
jgi:hypothetical protein